MLDKKHLKLVLEHITDGIWAADATDTIWYANKNVERITGIPIEKLIGCNVMEDFPAETLKHFAPYYQIARESLKTVKYFDVPLSISSQGVIYQSGYLAPSTEDGVYSGMICTVVDVTERKIAEAVLFQQTQALEQSIDGIAITDMKGLVRFSNRAWADMHGYSSSELSGQHVSMFHTKEQFKNEVMPFNHKVLSKGSYQDEVGHLHKDGSLFLIQNSTTMLLDSDGEASGFISIARDVTERKRAEQALLAAKKETDEANQLLEQSIARANQMAISAELANQAKSEFLANMSHEIRTPLNGVVGMTTLLSDTALSAQQEEYTSTIHTCAHSLLNVINDILDFSKIEAGKLVLEQHDFDLTTVLETATDLVAFRAHEKELELVTMVHSSVPALLQGDSCRLQQVLINLLNNAIKFTAKGEVTLQATLDRQEGETSWIHFSVVDTGIGIAEDATQTLFRSFTQADSSTTRQYGGTGLGLAICKNIVELMGGEIGVHSQLGRGSTFWFAIPFLRQPQQTAQRTLELSHVRVLVVDRLATSRDWLETIITPWGCQLDTATSAAEAMQKLELAAHRKNPYSIAIVDELLANEDAHELEQWISEQPQLTQTVTAIMIRIANKQTKQGPYTVWLSKPIKASVLRSRFVELFDKKASDVDSAESPADSQEPHCHNPHLQRSCSQNPGNGGGAEDKSNGHPRILLAEDNNINKIVALTMLKKLGYTADAVENGLEALQALTHKPYDLVLMDCQMPEMDGYEATRQIRRDLGVLDNQIPIVAMTANAMQGDREKCIGSGMDDYLAKPIEPQALADMLSKWLQK